MTPEERQRIEAIRERAGKHGVGGWWWEDVPWLLELVERQEAELQAIANGRVPSDASKGVTSL